MALNKAYNPGYIFVSAKTNTALIVSVVSPPVELPYGIFVVAVSCSVKFKVPRLKLPEALTTDLFPQPSITVVVGRLIELPLKANDTTVPPLHVPLF